MPDSHLRRSAAQLVAGVLLLALPALPVPGLGPGGVAAQSGTGAGESPVAAPSAGESPVATPSAGGISPAAPSAPGAGADSVPARGLRGSGSLLVPRDHWSLEALVRLDAFPGAGTAMPWGMGTPTRREVFRALAAAADGGTARSGGASGPAGGDDAADGPGAPVRATARAALARAYLERFREESWLEEFDPEGSDPDGWTPRWISGHWDLAVGRRYGALGTGQGRYEFIPPEPLGDARHLDGNLAGALEVGRIGVAGRVQIGEDGEPVAREAYLAGRIRGVDLWAGRRAPAFGGTRSGSIVLGGRAPLDGGGVALAGPRTLPSFLRHLGPVRFETHVARLEESGELRRPWFWAARGSVAPHPRLALALNRAAMFGGEGNAPMTVKNVALMLLGSRARELPGDLGRSFFANQIASLELRWRPPLERVPATVYLEWGLEDSAGAWWTVPGIVAGVQVAALPGAPGVSLGIERTHFAPECCENPPWYRHAAFTGGWADGGVPLGHPLGGEGDEWLLYGRADLLDARLRTGWRLFHRDRAGDNLFMPAREGTSLGGALEVLYRVGGRTDLTLDGFYERGRGGDGWSELRAFVGFRSYF